MPNDRLKELNAATLYATEGENVVDIALSSRQNVLEIFRSQVEVITGDIDRIKKQLDVLKRTYAEVLSNPVNEAKTQDDLDKMTVKVTRELLIVRDKLKSMSDVMKNDASANSVEQRIRKTQWMALSRQYSDLLTVYSDLQVDFRARCKKRIQRQLLVAGQQVKDEQLEELITSAQPQIFTQMIIADTQLARQTLTDIEARHYDIMKLELSIEELREMLLDIARLSESQGDITDRIEINIGQAQEQIGAALADTKKAVIRKNRTRKMQLYCIIFGIVVLLIVILVLVLFLIAR